MQDVKTVQAFVRMMKKEGVQVLRSGDLEIHLSAYAVIPQQKKSKTKNKTNSDYIPTEGYTDEDILNWSAPSVGLNG